MGNLENTTYLPTSDMLDYVKSHNRKDSLLYNNRLFFGYINPSKKRISEYEENRFFILKYFNKKKSQS
jgi:hypothetical protein